MAVDGEAYDLELCAEHNRLFDQQIAGWARLGREVEVEVRRPFAMTRERELERAGRALSALSAPPPDPKIAVVTKLPASYHTWNLTDHARQRCGERGVSERDALLAACDPGYAFPARSDAPNTYVHIRGGVAAVVNPTRRVVITVMARDQAEREREVVSG